MSKVKSVFTCQKCGAQRLKWEGRCHDCGSWNSFLEESFSGSPGLPLGFTHLDFLEKDQTGGKGKKSFSLPHKSSSFTLNLESLEKEAQNKRFKTHFSELDRVLGGGIVPGSYILLGGDPGVGKSTLLLQMSGQLAKKESLKVLYVSGEESVSQTALRAHRLGVISSAIEVLSESSLESILKSIKSSSPHIVIIDSIQTLFLSHISSPPGSILQIRECAGALMGVAKRMGITVILIGHVTKDGNLSGPKVLEHMVDTVLSFEGDANYDFRLLRSLKNRFGPTYELGVFQMEAKGLKDVKNPSELFLKGRHPLSVGSSIFAAIEGSRPLLCEVQALNISNSGPMVMPRRTTTGFDIHRLHMINAVLDKQLGLGLAISDVFINVVGGLKIKETAADLAAVAALISSARNLKVHTKACFFGELGLTGEIRGVNFANERIREALKLGFEHFVLPFSNKKPLSQMGGENERGGKKNFFWIRHTKELPKILKEIEGHSKRTTS